MTLCRRHMIREHVKGQQHGPANLRAGFDAASADLVEKVLETMRKALQGVVSEGTGTALDGMNGAEHAGDHVG